MHSPTRLLAWVLGTTGLFVVLSPVSMAQPVHNPQPPPEPRNDAGGVPYWGIVTEITRETISVRVDLPGQVAKRFKLSPTLAAGQPALYPRPLPSRPQLYTVHNGDTYRIADVRVGDHVVVRYSSINGAIECDHVRIIKRPGGRVPPIPDEADALFRPKQRDPRRPAPLWFPHHEVVNAHLDLEERGIPFPEHFGPYRRFPVAPPPREVVRPPAP